MPATPLHVVAHAPPAPRSASTEPVIETVALELRYGRKAALRDLTLSIPRGRIHAIVGANGAGKSSLFGVLLGFIAPTAGSARILGRDCRALGALTPRPVALPCSW